MRDGTVSILARFFERALRKGEKGSPVIFWFQSSPAFSSGRYRTTAPRPENTEFGLGFREPTANGSRLTGDSITDFIQVIEK